MLFHYDMISIPLVYTQVRYMLKGIVHPKTTKTTNCPFKMRETETVFMACDGLTDIFCHRRLLVWQFTVSSWCV